MKKVGIWMYENDLGYITREKIIKSLKSKGYEVISDFDMRECFCHNGKVYTKDSINLSDLDVLFHMNSDDHSEYQKDILKLIEFSGVKVFNPYEAFYNAKDKLMTNMLLSKAKINVPSSICIGNNFDKKKIEPILKKWGSFVFKNRTGNGGRGIIKFNDYETFHDFYIATKDFFEGFYLEEFIEFDDMDYRIEIFEGKVINHYSRKKSHSYKTNYKSGGSVVKSKIYKGHEKIALKACKTLGLTVTIVDILVSSKTGKSYVIEVNNIGIFLGEILKNDKIHNDKKIISFHFKKDKEKIKLILDHIDKLLNEK